MDNKQIIDAALRRGREIVAEKRAKARKCDEVQKEAKARAYDDVLRAARATLPDELQESAYIRLGNDDSEYLAIDIGGGRYITRSLSVAYKSIRVRECNTFTYEFGELYPNNSEWKAGPNYVYRVYEKDIVDKPVGLGTTNVYEAIALAFDAQLSTREEAESAGQWDTPVENREWCPFHSDTECNDYCPLFLDEDYAQGCAFVVIARYMTLKTGR